MSDLKMSGSSFHLSAAPSNARVFIVMILFFPCDKMVLSYVYPNSLCMDIMRLYESQVNQKGPFRCFLNSELESPCLR